MVTGASVELPLPEKFLPIGDGATVTVVVLVWVTVVVRGATLRAQTFVPCTLLTVAGRQEDRLECVRARAARAGEGEYGDDQKSAFSHG